MNRKRLPLFLLPALFAISPVWSAPSPPTPAHLIVSVHGAAQIQRRGALTWAPVLPGTSARRGDLLRLESGARLTLVCADLQKHELTGPRETGVPCVQTRPVLIHGHEAWSPTRGATPPSDRFPVLLSPRRTKVPDGHPVLRWTAVPGASSYLVRVRGDGVDWSTNLDALTELAYPDSAPALTPGSTYRVIVSADGRSSEEEGQSGLGFTLLNAEERTALEAEEARVRSLGLTPEETRLVLASLHASQGLRAAAITELEAFGSPPPAPVIARTLGDLFAEVGLGRRAEDSYLLALRLSRATTDPEGEGTVLERLGTFYDLVLGNRSEAATRWREAVAVYRQLGDAQAVKRLEDLLTAREHPESAAPSAEALLKEGTELAEQGSPDAALGKFQQALAVARETRDARSEALALFNSGVACLELDRPEQAVDSLSLALPLSRTLANPAALQVNVLVNLADGLARLGRRSEAIANLESALAAMPPAEPAARRAYVWEQLGSTHRKAGEMGRAAAAFERSLALYEEADNKRMQAKLADLLAGTLWATGNVERSLYFYDRDVGLWRVLGDREHEASVLQLLGDRQSKLSQPLKAARSYQQALALWRELGNREREARLLNDMGVLYEGLGNLAKAKDFFDEAFEIWTTAGNQAGQAEALTNQARFEWWADHPRQALELYTRALDLWPSEGRTAERGQTHSAIAAVQADLRKYPEAITHLSQAAALFQQAQDPVHQIEALRKLAQFRARTGDRRQGEAALEQAVSLSAHLEGVPPIFRALVASNLALGCLELGQPERALAFSQAALRLYQEMKDPGGQAGALSMIGFVQETRGAVKEAVLAYDKALALQEQIRSAAHIRELQAGAELGPNAAERAVVLHLQLGEPEKAFAAAEQARARSLLDQLGNVPLSAGQGAAGPPVAVEQMRRQLTELDRQLQSEREKPGPDYAPERVRDLESQLDRLRRQYDDLLLQLKLSNPEYASMVSVSIAGIPELQRLLDERTTLVAYFVAAEKVAAFVLTRESFRAVTLPVTGSELSALVSDARAEDRDPASPALAKLYASLIAPLRPFLRGPLLGFVPHGVLHQVPFAALTDGRRSLGEDFVLFHLPSASVLRYLRAKPATAGPKVLAVAQAEAEGRPTLQFAEAEARGIAGLFEPSRVLTGAEATVARVRELAGQFEIVHLAAHGELDAARPLFSRILLAPAPGSDGALDVQTIFGLDLARTRLVVLSACSSQIAAGSGTGPAGVASRGDDFVALSRAFLHAGAPTVIASLWEVDDESTQYQMTELYQQLRAGRGPAEALHEAQAKTRVRYPAPHDWAAFVLMGDPR